MAQFRPFNPVDAMQRGQSNQLAIQAQQQGIEREAQAAPIRSQMDKLGLTRAQRQERQDAAGFDQREVLQKAAILNQAARAIKGLDPSQYQAAFERMAPDLEKFGVDLSQLQGVQITPEGLDQVIAETQGFLSDPNKVSQLTGSNQRIQDDTKILQGALDEGGRLKPVNQLTSQQEAAAIRQGLLAKAGTRTKEERLALDEDLTEKVATSQSKIRSAVKQAEVQAKARGEAATDLIKQEAALPGIEEVVGKLKTLSDDATFTLLGKGFNAVSKQFGFSTSGDTSRTSMVSIVDNQVLPLLKPIFGAAFTAAEGDRLRNAFLDPDSTPESRKASLDAFLDQVKRNIEALRRENTPDRQDVDVVNLSDEELFQ